MKRDTKHKHNYYHKGRNVFGDKAKTELIVLSRETAFEQMLAAIDTLDGSSDTIESAFDTSCFTGHEEEFEEVMKKVDAFLNYKAELLNKRFYRM